MPIDIATTGVSGGGILGALIWVWKKISATEDKMTALELKIAEDYAPKTAIKYIADKLDTHIVDDNQAFRKLEDKVDHCTETLNTKLDTIVNILLAKKD